MSDEHDDGSPDELTPEQELTVRRLLSEARHDQPVPPAVADRLDRVLADLSRGEPVAPVVDLGARRRRRNAGRLLVAAAAVILAGVGIGQVVGNRDDSADSTSAESSALTDQAPDRASSDDHSQDQGSAGGAGADAPSSSNLATDGLVQALPLDLTSARLQQDVQDQLGALPSATKSDLSAPSANAGVDLLDTTAGFACDQPALTDVDTTDELLPAYYDGVPVVLALKPEPGGTQSGQLLECGTGDSVASFSITLR